MVYQAKGKTWMKDLFMFLLISLIRTVPQSTVALFATVGCIGLAGFLIASTVILALIPVFLPTKSVTPDPSMR